MNATSPYLFVCLTDPFYQVSMWNRSRPSTPICQIPHDSRVQLLMEIWQINYWLGHFKGAVLVCWGLSSFKGRLVWLHPDIVITVWWPGSAYWQAFGFYLQDILTFCLLNRGGQRTHDIQPWDLPSYGQHPEWHGGLGEDDPQGHLGSFWRWWVHTKTLRNLYWQLVWWWLWVFALVPVDGWIPSVIQSASQSTPSSSCLC